ncbi:hypothetical protein BH11MYX1_BH11MYX1_42340 [soil metagenome]
MKYRYGLDPNDSNNYALIVAGRQFPPPRTQGATKRIAETVAKFARKSKIPVELVFTSTATNWDPEMDDEEEYESGYIVVGIVLAKVVYKKHKLIETTKLDGKAYGKIPKALWTLLRNEHDLKSALDAIWLASSGWTRAAIDDGSNKVEHGEFHGDPLAVAAADGPATKLNLKKLPAKVWLNAMYL